MTPHATPQSRWITQILETLLHQHYNGKIPSLRTISQDMQESVGSTLSHGQIRNILQGNGTNLTDKTRRTLADFFDVPLAVLYPPDPDMTGSKAVITDIVTKLLTFNPSQLAAVQRAVEAVAEHQP